MTTTELLKSCPFFIFCYSKRQTCTPVRNIHLNQQPTPSQLSVRLFPASFEQSVLENLEALG